VQACSLLEFRYLPVPPRAAVLRAVSCDARLPRLPLQVQVIPFYQIPGLVLTEEITWSGWEGHRSGYRSACLEVLLNRAGYLPAFSFVTWSGGYHLTAVGGICTTCSWVHSDFCSACLPGRTTWVHFSAFYRYCRFLEWVQILLDLPGKRCLFGYGSPPQIFYHHSGPVTGLFWWVIVGLSIPGWRVVYISFWVQSGNSFYILPACLQIGCLPGSTAKFAILDLPFDGVLFLFLWSLLPGVGGYLPACSTDSPGITVHRWKTCRFLPACLAGRLSVLPARWEVCLGVTVTGSCISPPFVLPLISVSAVVTVEFSFTTTCGLPPGYLEFLPGLPTACDFSPAIRFWEPAITTCLPATRFTCVDADYLPPPIDLGILDTPFLPTCSFLGNNSTVSSYLTILCHSVFYLPVHSAFLEFLTDFLFLGLGCSGGHVVLPACSRLDFWRLHSTTG